MKTNHRHYILAIIALVVLLVSATGYILLYRRVISQARVSAQAQAEVALEDSKKLHERELAALYADTLNDRSRVKALVVPEDKIVDFIETIEKIGIDSGTELEISGINVEKGTTKDKNSLLHISANITAEGSWVNVMRALILVENLPYSLAINNVKILSSSETIQVKKGAPVVKRWNLSMTIRVLAQKSTI